MRSTSVETSRECSITGRRLSRTGLPIGFGQRKADPSVPFRPNEKEAARSDSLLAAENAIKLPTSRKNCRRFLSVIPLELEPYAKLRRKRRSPRRQFVQRPVLRSTIRE